jgi:hypothetical protein
MIMAHGPVSAEDAPVPPWGAGAQAPLANTNPAGQVGTGAADTQVPPENTNPAGQDGVTVVCATAWPEVQPKTETTRRATLIRPNTLNWPAKPSASSDAIGLEGVGLDGMGLDGVGLEGGGPPHMRVAMVEMVVRVVVNDMVVLPQAGSRGGHHAAASRCKFVLQHYSV